MADMVVVGYRTQALALPHHADGFALLVRSQLWLGPEFDASLLACTEYQDMRYTQPAWMIARRPPKRPTVREMQYLFDRVENSPSWSC